MTGSISAEVLALRKRASTWILLGIWTALAVFFAYVLPYVSYVNGSGGPAQEPLSDLLPQRLVGNVLAGFPFFGGVFALMVGVLTLGSEYGWGTLKTLLIQRPGRLHLFAAKLVAVAAALVPFVLSVFVLGAVASVAIAWREGAAVEWPAAWLFVRALGAGWLILAVWAALGVALGVLSRGTALAIGVGVLYALVIEGLISALAGQVALLEPLVELFLRANAYSVVEGLGVTAGDAADNGPGTFSGPFVGGGRALVVLVGYLAAFVLVAGGLIRRRDVA